jgi:hypothetical protein
MSRIGLKSTGDGSIDFDGVTALANSIDSPPDAWIEVKAIFKRDAAGNIYIDSVLTTELGLNIEEAYE